jgi:hypothetical protein
MTSLQVCCSRVTIVSQTCRGDAIKRNALSIRMKIQGCRWITVSDCVHKRVAKLVEHICLRANGTMAEQGAPHKLYQATRDTATSCGRGRMMDSIIQFSIQSSCVRGKCDKPTMIFRCRRCISPSVNRIPALGKRAFEMPICPGLATDFCPTYHPTLDGQAH